MPREAIEFPQKDIPLKEDVQLLGHLLGETLVEERGPVLLEQVEAVRLSAIARRAGEEGAEAAFDTALEALDERDYDDLVRAFSTYFSVVNLAERVHRIRRRRDYLRAQADPQPGSLIHTIGALKAQGLTAEELSGLFEQVCFEPVFTAHPTQATRRTLLEKQQRIARLLVDRMDPSLTPNERAVIRQRLRAEIAASWQTRHTLSTRPAVRDEVEHVLFYVTDILYRVIAPFYEELSLALQQQYPDHSFADRHPSVIRFGSWVGGDMDGNPNVTAATIRTTLAHQRELILRRYLAETRELARRLSQSTDRVRVAPAVLDRSVHYQAIFEEEWRSIPERYHDMPYRILLRFVAARLEATLADESRGYPDCDALVADLRCIADSLREHHGVHAGLFPLRRLICRAESFGFHLCTLDVRQDAMVHRRALCELLQDEDWLDKSADERCTALTDWLENPQSTRSAGLSAETAETLEIFRAIADSQGRYGSRAIGPFIISMAQGADDVLSVLALARAATAVSDDQPIDLDVAPLFETVDDLQAAPSIMAHLAQLAPYQQHLRARQERQIVMLGYSDSSKDSGIVSSRWALYRAQREVLDALENSPLQVTFFHGRGGTASRGGGRLHRSIIAEPPGSVRGRVRVTEQGEIIDYKYGLRSIAMRSLEVSVSALLHTAAQPEGSAPRQPEWQDLAEAIANDGRQHYRQLVYHDPHFVPYFRSATPIDAIERMRIGSRPASRRSGGGVENLRAIPWVFSWTQSRHFLPGWYGVGTALERAFDRGEEDALRAMASEWPFFGNLIDDVERVLAKADMAIARRYAGLADAPHAEVFERIEAEYERTVTCIVRLRGGGELLAHNPTLRRSIQVRNPYVDPMSCLQVELLSRWRAAGRPEDSLFHTLLATINGIAQGLHNTG